MLVQQLLARHVNCTIDFINERDHDEIRAACTNIDFPVDRCRIFFLPQSEVPLALKNYDCGFVFNSYGQWRSMSSPTKLGEYLAAGLFVVGLPGINVIDRLSKFDPTVINVFTESELLTGISDDRFTELMKNLSSPVRGERALSLARAHFDITIARLHYRDLYRHVASIAS